MVTGLAAVSALGLGGGIKTADAAGLHAAAQPLAAHHGVTSLSLGSAIGSDCKLWEHKQNSSVPYGSGHLNVYFNVFQCVTNTGIRFEQYQLYVNTSNGDLIADVPYQDNLAVRVWLVGRYQGTTYGPAETGDHSYASDTTKLYPAGKGPIWPYPQADDYNSYVTDTNGRDYFLPYLNF